MQNESFEKKNSTFIDIIKQSHNGLRILSIDISVEDFLYEYITACLCNCTLLNTVYTQQTSVHKHTCQINSVQ